MVLWWAWFRWVQELRGACARRRTFLLMCLVPAGLSIRVDRAGVSSFVRVLGLDRRLAEFAQMVYGKEALGILLNYLQPFFDQEPADFIAELFVRYPMEDRASPLRSLTEWRGMETARSI